MHQLRIPFPVKYAVSPDFESVIEAGGFGGYFTPTIRTRIAWLLGNSDFSAPFPHCDPKNHSVMWKVTPSSPSHPMRSRLKLGDSSVAA
jgi:hypothetical protein